MTDHEHCYRHPDVATGVHCTRCERPICPDCMIPASVGFHCPECVAEGRRTTRTARTIYGGKVRPGEDPGLVTKALIGINLVVFVITVVSGAGVLSGSGSSSLYTHFALIPPAVANGEWWRLFSAAFLHFGIFHIGFNMYALWLFGPPLEQMMGKARFLALYLLAGVGGNLLSVGLGQMDETAAGASGAIFGLFAAMYVIARHRNFNTQPFVFTIVANLVFTFAVPNIDWRGHVGGLVVGAAVAAAIAFAPRGPRRDLIQALGVVVIAAVLAVGGLLAVHRTNQRCEDLAVAPPSATSGSDLAACIIYDRPAVQKGERGAVPPVGGS